MKILDAGSGLGGPSRYLADVYGCSVIGLDLTPSFVAVSQLLVERTATRFIGGETLAQCVETAKSLNHQGFAVTSFGTIC